MSTSRLDYSELVAALKEHRKGQANELLEELLPRLKDYLEVTMNADPKDAEECVQQSFYNVYEQILEGNIHNEKYIFRYLIQACRNEYMRFYKEQHRFTSPEEDKSVHLTTPAQQFENLMDKDRQRILNECLDELEDESRELIEYFIDKPDASTREVSKLFNLSRANVRTRKSRILSRLHHCFKRKWDR